MLEQYPDEVVYAAGFALVALIVLGRIYVGEQYFKDRGAFWNPLRRRLVPWLHRVFQDADGGLYAETEMREEEYVGTLDDYPENVRDQLLEKGYQFNPLASLATDPDGNPEVASLAWFHGSTPFPGAPSFLRPRQVHVRLVDVSDPVGPRTAVYAHEEATSWRPDLWQDHYGAKSMDVELGVAIAAYDLGFRARLDDLVHGDAIPQEAR